MSLLCFGKSLVNYLHCMLCYKLQILNLCIPDPSVTMIIVHMGCTNLADMEPEHKFVGCIH